MKISGKLYSAKNHNGGFIFSKKLHVLTPVFSDIACWEYMNLRQKIIILKNLTMPKIVKGGPFGLFKTPICCKTFLKLMGSLATLKNFHKKSHKSEKKTKGDLLVSSGIYATS